MQKGTSGFFFIMLSGGVNTQTYPLDIADLQFSFMIDDI